MQSGLVELGLQSIDVGSAGDCFFRSVLYQLCGNSNHHMRIRTAGETKNFERVFLSLIVSYVSIVLTISMQSRVPLGPGKFQAVVLV